MHNFKCTADFEFEAQDITDAFMVMAEHFKNLSEGHDSDIVKVGKFL